MCKYTFRNITVSTSKKEPVYRSLYYILNKPFRLHCKFSDYFTKDFTEAVKCKDGR